MDGETSVGLPKIECVAVVGDRNIALIKNLPEIGNQVCIILPVFFVSRIVGQAPHRDLFLP